MTTNEIIAALKTLGLDAETMFARIRGAIERGDMREARAQLDWVDALLEAAQ
jgi:hypothetical protein